MAKHVDPYNTVVTVAANVTLLRVINEARKTRDESIVQANATRDALIANANLHFISTICSAAVDLDASIVAMEYDDDDDDDDGDDD